MEEFVNNFIWIDSIPLKYYGFNIGTRMTVIRLNDGNLFLHSPTKLTNKLKTELDKIGKVRFLIAPNKLHHMYINEYSYAYPDAEIFAAKDLLEKRKDLRFIGVLDNCPRKEWNESIDQVLFQGSIFTDEVIFFHKESQTLIVTDLLEQYDEMGYFQGFKEKIIAFLLGIYKTPGLPIDEKLFVMNKKVARESIERILMWDFNKIIMAHGPLIRNNAKDLFFNAFKWLLKNRSTAHKEYS